MPATGRPTTRATTSAEVARPGPASGPPPEAGLVRLRLDVAYDGSAFSGLARQPGLRTVQGDLEAALGRMVGRAVETVAAGRTDAGVHATHQVLHADVPERARAAVDGEWLRRGLDRQAGPELAVLGVRRAPATFHARFSASSRRYRYLLGDAPAADPLSRHLVWHVGAPRLDVDAMRAGGALLTGEHDFSSFCRRRDRQHLVRRVDRLGVRRLRAGLVQVVVAGPAFCHQQVRSMVGCLLRVGRRSCPPEWVAEVLAARDRHAVGQVAPPHGLTLVGVSYAGAGRARPSG